MNETVKLNECPNCGIPIPATAPQGLCPKCVLLRAASGEDPDLPAALTGEAPSIERVSAAFPQLEVLELIGHGGMGYVFKARQPRLDRLIALKLLPDKLALQPHFAERFNREGRVLARLNHPNIVSVYDFGVTEHFCFLLMEYVDGVNLRQAMQSGRFSPGEALSIVPKICEALQYAHEQGILHRDIKPANILLDTRGRVKIADFGIAKLVGEKKPDVTLTATGVSLGTPHYMAPEQLEKPSEVDHRADIYSLGVVFYEMLTGELPLGRFAPPSSKTPVGADVDQVVFRTLEKDRERRYQSAGEMKTQVEHLGDPAGSDFQAPELPGVAAESRSDRTTAIAPANPPHAAHSERRPLSRFVYLGLLLAGIGAVLVPRFTGEKVQQTSAGAGPTTERVSSITADAEPSLHLTFTAVELRELPGGRWLAIDYLDDVHGEGQKAFAWHSTIPGFKAETRASEFFKEGNGSPPIRHQRIEFRLPDDMPRERLESLRTAVEKALHQKSIQVEMGGQALLFELLAEDDASLKGWIKMIPLPVIPRE